MKSRVLTAIARSVAPGRCRHLPALATLALATLASTDAALAVDESIPCDPEPTDMSISYSDVVSCGLDVVGDTDTFRFSATAGDGLTVLASRVGGTASPCIQLFDPGGGPVASQCGTSARINAIVDQTGLHSILVSEAFNDQTTNYSLVVERVGPPSLSARYICPGCELQDSIDPVGDLDLFFFVGSAGDVVTLLASRVGGIASPCIQLFDPGGGPVASQCGTSARIDATLAQTGLYSILAFEAFNDQRSDYTLSYQCIVGVCFDLIIFTDDLESGDTSAWSSSVP